MDKNLMQIKALREGGQVTRCHTYGQYHGTYDVAQHTFNMMSMAAVLYDGLEEDLWLLMEHIMWHDIPERWTGDVPHPAKHTFPELNAALKKADTTILKRLGRLTPADPDFQLWITWLDLLEVCMWARDQVQRGNVMVVDLLEAVDDHFEKSRKSIPAPVQEVYMRYTPKRLRKLPDFLERDADGD